MARKKILWLCSWYPGKTEPFNGDFIQRHARAAALYNDIHVIHVTADATGIIRQPEEEFYESPGLTEHILYFRKQNSIWGKLKAQIQWSKYFRSAIKQYIRKNGLPDVVHVHVPVKAGIFALWLKRKYKIPFIITEHWGIYNDIEKENYKIKSAAFKNISKQIFSQADVFLTVSKYVAEGVNKLVIKKDFSVLPNVVNTDFFYYQEKHNRVFRFIHVSNMVPLKNAEGILKAFKSLTVHEKDTELVMIGDTGSAIRDFAQALELPSRNVFFKGEIAYEQVAREMQAADCFILFSNIENSPCVIGEALCCGLPVIATNVGGVPEITDNTNSVIVEPGDEEGLVNTMKEMISRSNVYNMKKIAENAKSKFSYDIVGKKLDETYSLLIPDN